MENEKDDFALKMGKDIYEDLVKELLKCECNSSDFHFDEERSEVICKRCGQIQSVRLSDILARQASRYLLRFSQVET